MRDLLRDSIFGRLAHLASNGKLFLHEEQRDPSRLQKYIVNKSESASETSVKPATDSSNGNTVELEKGTDVQLVGWIENDPEVCKCFQPLDTIISNP